MKQVKIKYHNEKPTELHFVGGYDKSCAVDVYAVEDFKIGGGQFGMINLGISLELPEGHMALMMPRSSTFKKYGIIQTNSIGLIDESYCGDNDVYHMPVFKPTTIVDNAKIISNFTANLMMPVSEVDDTPILIANLNKVSSKEELLDMMLNMIKEAPDQVLIPKGTNIAQILILPRMEMMEFLTVDKLNNADRSGFGSTDNVEEK